MYVSIYIYILCIYIYMQMRICVHIHTHKHASILGTGKILNVAECSLPLMELDSYFLETLETFVFCC